MKKTLSTLLLASTIALSVTVSPILAQEEAAAYRETQLGLYVTAKEAYELMQDNERAVLVDVRDPVEIKFTGFAEPTDIHVPWVLADRSSFDEESRSWPMVKNEAFEKQIKTKLEALDVAKDDPVIVMCRSGSTRSAPAADVITEMGYSDVYSVTDGFEGGKLEEGDSKGVRAVSGWRNAGLPWSYQVDPDVAWQADE
ncbi:rhodanese-like domain-containing protein [Pistricoccus aurantiacus]|uniref:rhodanese-like domain-containing protein n=1 Tax=Pistricoccus aurantiacus TaxID=1883414 RepID=UPI003632C175